MNYGLPYKGSKRKLADKIVKMLPPAQHFYDLFCGGCAVAHYALTLTAKYKQVHINDLDSRMPTLFYDALTGNISDERLYQWISREDFQMFAPTDGLIAVCWSFGNNMKGYLYDERRERLKGCAHRLIFSKTIEERHKGYIALIREVQSLVADIAEEYEKHHEWRAEQEHWRELNEVPRGLMEKNRKSWEIAMMRTECMMPLIRYFREAFDASNVSMKELEQHLGTQMAGHYFTTGSQWCLPTREHYAKLQQVMKTPKEYDALKKEYDARKKEYDARKKEYDARKPMFDYLSTGKTDNERVLDRLQELVNIESANLIKSLRNQSAAQRLSVTLGDYQQVHIEPDSIIYCDPPYKNTDDYDNGTPFDHERFYDWCCRQSVPVFISEYDMPSDRFRCIAEFDHQSALGQNGCSAVTERLFVPIHQEYKAEQAQLTLF